MQSSVCRSSSRALNRPTKSLRDPSSPRILPLRQLRGASRGCRCLPIARVKAIASTFAVERNLTVLLVEDSRLLADRLREAILNVPGALLVGTVDSESEAVATLNRMPIDVVLVDINLRRGTGFGVLRAIAERAHDNVVAIVLTNHDLGEYRRAAMELGARHFLDKMRDFDRLPALLQQIGSRRGEFAPQRESVSM
jgi:two-component system OmpR family response regulator